MSTVTTQEELKSEQNLQQQQQQQQQQHQQHNRHRENQEENQNENNEEEKENSSSRYSSKLQPCIVATAALSAFLFGFDSSVVNGTVFLQSKDLHFPLESWQTSLVISCGVIGAFFGSILSGEISQRYGRRSAMILADLFFLSGSIGVAVSPSLGYIFAFRVIIGIGIGAASQVAPAYLAESVSEQSRGAAITINNLGTTTGQLAASCVAVAFVIPSPELLLGWRWIYGIAALIPLIQLILLQWLPESPRWLKSKGRSKEEINRACDILKLDPSSFFDGKEEEEEEQEREESKNNNDNNSASLSITDVFCTSSSSSSEISSIRSGVGIASILMLCQQLTGINGLMYASSLVLAKIGFGGNKDPIIFSVPLGFISAIGNLLGARVVDLWGRRPLLLTSITGCLFSTLIFAITSTTTSSSSNGHHNNTNTDNVSGHHHNNTSNNTAVSDSSSSSAAAHWIMFSMMCVYLFFFQGGLGGIPWLVPTEVIPTKFRSTGVAISTCVNWASNSFFSFGFPLALKYAGDAVVFFVISCFCLITGIWVWFYLPETNGLSLEEIALRQQKQQQQQQRIGGAGQNGDENEQQQVLDNNERRNKNNKNSYEYGGTEEVT